jgi:esterase/lipase superfamily enzyme
MLGIRVLRYSLTSLATLVVAFSPAQAEAGEAICTGRPQQSAVLDTTVDAVYVVTTRASIRGPNAAKRAPRVSYYRANATLTEPRRSGLFAEMEREGLGRRLCRDVRYRRVERDRVLDDVQNRLGTPGAWHHGALVFVHGFNNSFDEAVDRAIVIKHRLRYDGAVIVFAWPSEAHRVPTPSAYRRDSASADQSIPALRGFLSALAGKTDPSRVHLIAHSMGSRVLAGALDADVRPRTGPHRGRRFASVAFLAPDIDAARFRDRVVPAVRRVADRVTLYATEGDRALASSGELHAFGRVVGVAGDLLGRRSADIARLAPMPRAGEVFGAGRDAVRSPLLETVVLPPEAPILWGESIWGLRKVNWVRSAIRREADLDDLIRHSMHTEGTALYDLLWNVGRNIRARCRFERGLSRSDGGIWRLHNPNDEVLDYRVPSLDCQMPPDTLRTDAELTVDLAGDSIAVVRAVYASLSTRGYTARDVAIRPGTEAGDILIQTSPLGPRRVQVTTHLRRLPTPVHLRSCAHRTMYQVEVSAREQAPRLTSTAAYISQERVAFVVRGVARALSQERIAITNLTCASTGD